MKINFPGDKRALVAIFIILMVVFEVTAYVTTTPRPTEQFFQLYLLGANHLAADYYPGNNPSISLDEPVTWYLGVTDSMGSVQLVSIRVKISNQSISLPDERPGLESPGPAVTDFTRFLQNNETWEVPFVWSISNATRSGEFMRVLSLQINNETYQIPDWSARNGQNFRLVFELWTWQTDNDTFEFGWNTNGQPQAAWLQVWFNMTSPSPHP
jgi:uncharacterized membrane protein